VVARRRPPPRRVEAPAGCGRAHLTKPEYTDELHELDRFSAWLAWFEGQKHHPRPFVWARVPDYAWTIEKEYSKAHPKPPPTPPPPPPPKPPPSWTLTNGPWIFVESDPGTVPAGPWTRLDIVDRGDGRPYWYVAGGSGYVPQAEGGVQSAATLDWIKQHKGPSIAPVTTLGIDVAPYLALGVTSCMVECYLQGQANALDKYSEAFREGWPDVIPVIGVGWSDQNGTYDVADYVGWLTEIKVGTRFGVYASDPMSAKSWADLRSYLG
jgi:hypothetical protein